MQRYRMLAYYTIPTRNHLGPLVRHKKTCRRMSLASWAVGDAVAEPLNLHIKSWADHMIIKSNAELWHGPELFRGPAG